MDVPVSLPSTTRSNPAEQYVEVISYLWGTLKEPKPFPCKEQKYSVISGKVP